jgi:UDP-N-acetylglucosamine 4-epimerase
MNGLSAPLTKHEVFNVACGDQISLNELVSMLRKVSGKNIDVLHGSPRKGDVRHSKASIVKLNTHFGYVPKFSFRDGLEITYNWYIKNSL